MPLLFCSYMYLGMTLHQLNDIDNAVAAYDKAISLEPTEPILHLNYGEAMPAPGRGQALAQVCVRKVLWMVKGLPNRDSRTAAVQEDCCGALGTVVAQQALHQAQHADPEPSTLGLQQMRKADCQACTVYPAGLCSLNLRPCLCCQPVLFFAAVMLHHITSNDDARRYLAEYKRLCSQQGAAVQETEVLERATQLEQLLGSNEAQTHG